MEIVKADTEVETEKEATLVVKTDLKDNSEKIDLQEKVDIEVVIIETIEKVENSLEKDKVDITKTTIEKIEKKDKTEGTELKEVAIEEDSEVVIEMIVKVDSEAEVEAQEEVLELEEDSLEMLKILHLQEVVSENSEAEEKIEN